MRDFQQRSDPSEFSSDLYEVQRLLFLASSQREAKIPPSLTACIKETPDLPACSLRKDRKILLEAFRLFTMTLGNVQAAVLPSPVPERRRFHSDIFGYNNIQSRCLFLRRAAPVPVAVTLKTFYMRKERSLILSLRHLRSPQYASGLVFKTERFYGHETAAIFSVSNTVSHLPRFQQFLLCLLLCLLSCSPAVGRLLPLLPDRIASCWRLLCCESCCLYGIIADH